MNRKKTHIAVFTNANEPAFELEPIEEAMEAACDVASFIVAMRDDVVDVRTYRWRRKAVTR